MKEDNYNHKDSCVNIIHLDGHLVKNIVEK